MTGLSGCYGDFITIKKDQIWQNMKTYKLLMGNPQIQLQVESVQLGISI